MANALYPKWKEAILQATGTPEGRWSKQGVMNRR